MTPNLIGLTGRSGTGKDTIARELRIIAQYQRIAFADPIRDAAYKSDPYVEVEPFGPYWRLSRLVDAVGWDRSKRSPDVRRYLQRYAAAFRRTHPDLWTDIASRHIAAYLGGASAAQEPRPVVVTDVRFPDEADLIRTLGGVIVRLHRDAAHDLGSNASHESEAVDRLDVDLDVHNDREPAPLARFLDQWASDMRGGQR